MKHKKFLYLLVLLLIGTLSVFLSFNNIKSANAENDPTQTPIEISIVPNDKSYIKDNKTVCTVSNSSVSVRIKADKIPSGFTGDIKVYYKTENYTAMKEYNEYTPADSYVTLTKSKPEAVVRIYTGYTAKLVDNNTRIFQIRIYDVTVNDSVCKNYNVVKNIVFADTMPKNSIYTTTYGTNVYDKTYGLSYDFYPSNKDFSHQSSGSLYESTAKDWYWIPDSNFSDYVNSGEAIYCVSGRIRFKSDHTWNWFDDDNTQIDVYNNDVLYFRNEDNQKNKGDGNYFGIGGEDGSETCYNGAYKLSFTNRSRSTYLVTPNAYSSYFDFEFKSWDCTCGVWYNGWYNFIIVDLKQAKPIYWSVSNGDAKYGEDIYISVRYNEPVRVTGTPVLQVALTNEFLYSKDSLFNFTYDGGSGSNTLVFKCNTKDIVKNNKKKALECTQLYPVALSEKSTGSQAKIYDYGLNNAYANNLIVDCSLRSDGLSSFKQNECDPVKLSCPLKASIDLREPEIAITRYFNAGINQTNQCTIKIDNASKDAVIYYEWVDASLPKAKEPFEIDDSTNLGTIYKNRMLNEGGDSATGNSMFIVGSNLNGEKYLHLTIRSAFGLTHSDMVVSIDSKLSKPVMFDSSIPTITEVEDTKNSTYKEKIINFKVEEGPEVTSSGINLITMVYTNNRDSYVNYMLNGVLDSGFKKSVVFNDESPVNSGMSINSVDDANGKRIYDITMSVTATGTYIGLSDSSPLPYDTFYIGFIIEDKAGNVTEAEKIDIRKYDFDIRNIFDSEIVIESGSDPIYSLPNEQLYIFQTSGTSPKTFTINKFKNEQGEYDDGELEIASIKNELGEDVPFDKFCTIDSSSIERITVKIKLLSVGYYEVTFGYNKNTETQEYDKVSRPYKFYLTKNKFDETLNKNALDNNGELINLVFMLDSSKYFYKNNIGTVVTGTYNNTTLQPAFSSLSFAKSYIKYHEYQDFYVYKIETQDQADTLINGNISEMFLAQGESHTPTIGDYYIRYKKANWVYGDISPSSWVYYYYSNDTPTINIARITSNLEKAVEEVSKTILATGKDTFLTDNYLDKYGTPKLDPRQYHVSDESVLVTKSGCDIIGASFSGDTSIWNSTITTASKDQVRLLTNYEFSYSNVTRVFYKLKGSNEKYTELEPYNNNLRTACKTSGVFEILEVDGNGVSIYDVYIDYTSPIVSVTTVVLLDGVETSIVQNISPESDGKTFNAKSITFSAMNEIDPFGYVAVYKMNAVGRYLVNVFSKKEIESIAPVIENGNYVLKVYDRSGNNYTIYLITNDSELAVEAKIISNTSITFTVNREESEVQTYEIYRDGNLLTSKFEKTKTFKESGIYRIVLIDWFSNVCDQEYEFTRTIEDISWKYSKGETEYIYNPEDIKDGLSIDPVDGTTSNVYTNGQLSILYPMGSDYSIKFIGYEPETSKTTGAGGKTMITIKAEKSYTVVVYYTDFEDVEMVYNVMLDSTEPIISVSSKDVVYIHNEDEQVANYVNGIIDGTITMDLSKVGTLFPITDIGYKPDTNEGETDHFISNNSSITAKLINVSLSDESIVTLCEVYLDDKLIYRFEDPTGVKDFSLSRTGKYRIEATDVLHNKAIFNFTNAYSSKVEVSVDKTDKSVEETKDFYGNSSYKLTTKDTGTLKFLVKHDDNYYYYSFVLEENRVTRSTVYYANEKIKSESENPLDVGTKTIEIRETLVFGEESKDDYIFKVDDYLVLTFSYDKEKNGYVFNFESQGDNEYVIYTKYFKGKYEPTFITCNISCKTSSVLLKTESGTTHIADHSGMVFTNEKFWIDKESINPNEIKEVIVVNEKTQEEFVIYSDGVFDNYSFGDCCSYTIYITNIYGNVSKCIVTISDSFSIIKTVYLQGEENTPITYSADYVGKIYSNYKVVLYILSLNPSIQARKNNSHYFVNSEKDNEKTIVTIDGNGTYEFVIKDEFNNEIVLNIEIKQIILNFPDELLEGFPEKANKKDGYTKNALSINSDQIRLNNISYIEINKEGNSLVVFDEFNEKKVEDDKKNNDIVLDPLTKFTEMMENNGSGNYQVIVRDVYGNKVVKDIHYLKENSLVLSRTTRSDGTYQPYDIDIALVDGFCSNNSLRFESLASNYKFYIDNSESDLPRTLTFGQNKDECEIRYEDEYGYVYSFKTKLYRTDVVVQAKDPSIFKDLGGILTTNKSFEVEYSKNSKCTYVFNNEVYEYNGEMIREDGVYRFTVTDFAGNVSTITYKKDSICEFSLTDQSSGKVLVSGDISNNANVQFKSLNADGVYVKYGFIDGRPIKDLSMDRYTESGHYELLIMDQVGNESFFDFYIYNHPMKGIEYTTPYTYVITSITCETTYGGVISMLGLVDQTVPNQSTIRFGTYGDKEVTSNDDGYYEVSMYSSVFGKYSTFTFTIDNNAPTCELVGCGEGETTLNDITIKGYQIGDTVKIFKDGELYNTVLITSNVSEVPPISSGGEYVIEITNESGLTQTLSFTRTHISNAAGSVLIILGAVVINLILIIGLIYRTKTKIDN